jgi:hypothetical protein
MARNETKPLAIAVRVYPEPNAEKERFVSSKPWREPKAILVFDTETRIDATQRLTFGSWRFIVEGRCLEEGLFSAPDLPDEDRRILERYVAKHKADTVSEGNGKLLLLPLGEFLDKVFMAAYRGRCLVVGFNLPFDLSRLASDFASARGRFAGGFSLGIWTYRDKEGGETPNRFRPRIGIKHIDSKRALKGFTARNAPDRSDLIPEDSETGNPEKGYKFRGHFLDLRTLAFALTDQSYSLESACKAFSATHGKQATNRHGSVTARYIDYNLGDIRATYGLALKLLEEYRKHPIALQVTKAYSPASIGKAYLRAMGIRPILERQTDFPKAYLGYAQSAFFGGRTSAHVRKVPVPVVYTDFLSMYPTVNSLMHLWAFVISKEIVVEHCKTRIERFLRRLRPKDLFRQETWKQLAGFVRIVPEGDVLPNRSNYGAGSNDWQVAVNYVHTDADDPNRGLWYSLPDIVASVLLTGRIPKIVDAFRIKPRSRLEGLKSTKLRGVVEIDPRKQDFFKSVIEERKRIVCSGTFSQIDKQKLDRALKVLANAASYGIYAEMNREESEKEVSVSCHGIDPKPYECKAAHPEVPGEYCFPPLPSLITGGARLMLALLEHCVAELGGTYAMEDTDSMAIVSTRAGGLVPCPGGPYRTKDGKESIKALSWKQTEEIRQRFAGLNPYDKAAVPGSILKIEDDNFDLTGKQRQLYCLAISAKRYALFVTDSAGKPTLLQKAMNSTEDHWSEHGLGHLLNPTDPDCEDRDWIAQSWLRIVRRSLGLPTTSQGYEGKPAIGRVTVSRPAVMRPLANLNQRKPYREQIKPFNFILTCHVNALGHPVGTDPSRFHLIAPYDADSRNWVKAGWTDQYTGKTYRIATTGQHGTRHTARVRTYGEILTEYEFHPESKCADANGNDPKP